VESYVLSKYGIGNTPTLDAPTFTPGAGIYPPGQSISISQDQGATCWFTTNGTTPSASLSSQWFNTNPITPYSTLDLQAIGVMPFFNNSSVASGTFQLDPLSQPLPRNGLVLWLRGDNGITLGSGTKITNWADSSGSGNTASQSTSSKEPTIVTGAINGLSAVAFNGTSDFLNIPSGMSNFSSGASIFAVVDPTSVTAGARILDFGNGTTSDNIYLDLPSSTGASLYTYAGSSGTSVTSSSAITTGQYQLLEAIDNGSGTATIYTNGIYGAQNTSMNTMNNLTRADCFIGQASGTGSFFKGNIAELIVFNRGVTATEQATIEGYLSSKYQLLTANTVTAPTISVATSTLTAPTLIAIEAPAAATIYWTNTGSAPTTSSPVYSGPIPINYTQTIKAIAVISGVESSVASATYTLNSTQFPAPGSTSTPVQLNLQLPTVAIPQDSNQH
jgi:hypothetical protein